MSRFVMTKKTKPEDALTGFKQGKVMTELTDDLISWEKSAAE